MFKDTPRWEKDLADALEKAEVSSNYFLQWLVKNQTHIMPLLSKADSKTFQHLDVFVLSKMIELNPKAITSILQQTNQKITNLLCPMLITQMINHDKNCINLLKASTLENVQQAMQDESVTKAINDSNSTSVTPSFQTYLGTKKFC